MCHRSSSRMYTTGLRRTDDIRRVRSLRAKFLYQSNIYKLRLVRRRIEDMISAVRISKIVGVSEEEIINKSLISFIEIEIRLAEADIADIRERYNVISKEGLYEAIKSKKIASHPAWEDYIIWKNKERYMEDLKAQANFIR